MTAAGFGERAGFARHAEEVRRDRRSEVSVEWLREIRERIDLTLRETRLLVADSRRAVARTRALVRGADGSPGEAP